MQPRAARGAGAGILGTQTTVWDTQEDMAMCGIGAIVSLATLSRWHNRQIGRFSPP
jgi:putative membrane protein